MSIFPLWWSAFSETFGRRTIYLASFSLFLLFNILSAISQTIAQLIVFRMLSGGAAASVQAVGAGTIADVWDPRERGRAMGMFYLGRYRLEVTRCRKWFSPKTLLFPSVVFALFNKLTPSSIRSSMWTTICTNHWRCSGAKMGLEKYTMVYRHLWWYVRRTDRPLKLSGVVYLRHRVSLADL